MSAVVAIAAHAVARAVTRIMVAARETVPHGVVVARDGDTIVLSGRDLRARSLTDPALRGIGR